MVIADYREREVAAHLKEIGATVSTMPLQVGDFVCSKRIVVERKDHSDYVNSVIDGRIFEQSERMRNSFEKSIIIIEGSSDRVISENAYLASLAKLASYDGVSLIRTKSPEETAKTIFWIAKKEQEEKRLMPVAKLGKKPYTAKEMQEWVVASLPGVSGVISKRLLDHFGTVESVMKAEEKDLTKVKGVGRSLAKRIRSVVVKKYHSD
jgi:Fanconi anemia group M protein